MHSSADAYVCVCVSTSAIFIFVHEYKVVVFWFNLRATLLGLHSTNMNSTLWSGCGILIEWYINVFNVSENS